jgi:hypothetical protein
MTLEIVYIWLKIMFILFGIGIYFIRMSSIIIFGKHVCVGVHKFKKNIIALAVNIIVLWILDSEIVKE